MCCESIAEKGNKNTENTGNTETERSRSITRKTARNKIEQIECADRRLGLGLKGWLRAVVPLQVQRTGDHYG